VRILPTDSEIVFLSQQMSQAIASNPAFAQYIDTFKILRIAKEDVKLAEEYYRLSMKKMLEDQQAIAQRNQEMNIQGQQQSAIIAEEEKRKSLQMELALKKQISDAETNNDLKKSMVSGLFQLYAKGGSIPDELKLLAEQVINNVAMPLFQENAKIISDTAKQYDEAKRMQEQQKYEAQQQQQAQDQQQGDMGQMNQQEEQAMPQEEMVEQ
jgi:hypothetical protein